MVSLERIIVERVALICFLILLRMQSNGSAKTPKIWKEMVHEVCFLCVRIGFAAMGCFSGWEKIVGVF